MGKSVAGKAVDDPESVAEIVIEARADDARRQRVAHIADVLANLVPGVGTCFALALPCRLTKIVVTPARVKLRRKSR